MMIVSVILCTNNVYCVICHFPNILFLLQASALVVRSFLINPTARMSFMLEKRERDSVTSLITSLGIFNGPTYNTLFQKVWILFDSNWINDFWSISTRLVYSIPNFSIEIIFILENTNLSYYPIWEGKTVFIILPQWASEEEEGV